MGRVAETLVAGALMAGLASCGSEYPTNFIDSTDQQLVEQTVQEAGKFWADQGIGLGSDLRTEVAVGDQRLSCGGSTITSESMEMTYCKGENVMAFSVGGINQIRINGGTIALKAWVREAVGGLVQREDPSLIKNAPTDSDQRDLYVRWQRACLAGIVTYNVAQGDTPDSFQTFLNTGDTRTEGHWLSRAYAHGYQAQTTDRQKCVDIPLPPDWTE